MADLEWREVNVVDAMVALFEENIEVLGIKRVYWGDQEKIPEYPAICVAPFPKDRALSGEGATHRFAITHRIGIHVYHGQVQSSELNHRIATSLAEDVEQLLHKNTDMADMVIFGYVTRMQPGFSMKEQTMVKVTRLLWEARSRETFI